MIIYLYIPYYLVVCIDIWSIAISDNGTTAGVRSLYWEGYGFYTTLKEREGQAGTALYGGAYFGHGLPNTEIAFML